MTYEETLAKIDTYQRFSRRPGLERMAALLSVLGNPQEKLKFVHVAGTNGKGTVCTLISSVLTAAGYKTGLYLSPHVCDFCERIQLCGKLIPRLEFENAAERVFFAADKLGQNGIKVNFFEVVTAIAMMWFAEKQCDVVVLEVGLGGRFDATNVIKTPLVSVIVSISLDHTEVLGNTVAEIAGEKCGIIKRGCPVVCSPEEPPEALEVIRAEAGKCESHLTEASLHNIKILNSNLAGTELLYGKNKLNLPFIGAHQIRNAATALAVLNILKGMGWNISSAALRNGFTAARLPARLEVLSREPPVLIDGAHNPGGTAALASALRYYLHGRKIFAIMGMMADKDTKSAVENLSAIFTKVFAAAPPSPRAMDAEAFASLWRQAGTPAQAAENGRKALQMAFSELGENDAIVICGSLYLAGELRGPAIEIIKNRKK